MNETKTFSLDSLDPEAVAELALQLEERKRLEKEEKKRAQREKEVKQILDALASGNFHATQRDRIAFLLKNYPDTRDSDMALTLRYWREFQPEIYVNDAINPGLLFKLERLTTIARLRAKIQNEYGLFLGSADVQQKRRQKESEIKETMIKDKAPPKVIHIFADETGKTGDYLIVGSVWFLNVSRTAAFQADVMALCSKLGMNAVKEFHFSECKDSNLDLYKSFIDLAAERLEYVVLKAVIAPRKGIQRKLDGAVGSMVRQLILKGFEQEVSSSRVTVPRTIDFTMDEGGLDAVTRGELPDLLAHPLEAKFGEGNRVGGVFEISSKASAAIQLADMFCGALNRKFNGGGAVGKRSPKEELAEYIFSKLDPFVSEMDADETLSLIELK